MSPQREPVTDVQSDALDKAQARTIAAGSLLLRAYDALGWSRHELQALYYQGGLVHEINQVQDEIDDWRTNNA